MREKESFFGALFDTSFRSLITPKVIKLLYVLSMIVIGLFALVAIVSAFHTNSAVGLLTLFIIAPVGGLLYLVYTRVLLELVIAIFRIMETNQSILEFHRASAPPAPDPAPSP